MPWGEQHQPASELTVRARRLATKVRSFLASPTTSRREGMESALEAFDEEDRRRGP